MKLGQEYKQGLVIQRSDKGSAFQTVVDATIAIGEEKAIEAQYDGGIKKVNIEGLVPTGTKSITDTALTDVTNYANAQVVDANLTADNIKKNVNILGISGTYEGGGTVTGDCYVEVVDYDGTIVDSGFYNVGDVYTLPSAPVHSGLTFEEWYTLDAPINNGTITIPADTDCILIGPYYHTTSGALELVINIPSNNYTVKPGGENDYSIGTVDFGDGSPVENYNDFRNGNGHTYTNSGDYIIKIYQNPNSSQPVGYFSNMYSSYGLDDKNYRNVTEIRMYDISSFTNPTSRFPIKINANLNKIAFSSLGFISFVSKNDFNGEPVPSYVDKLELFIRPKPSGSTSGAGVVFTIPANLNIKKIIETAPFLSTTPSPVFSAPDTEIISLNCLNQVRFKDLGKLKYLNIHSSEQNISIKSSAFMNIDIKSLKFPNTVRDINSNAFAYSEAEKIVFEQQTGETIETVAMSTEVFTQCTRLKEVILPNGLTTIGRGTFYNCMELSAINIPNTVTTIDNNAFGGCAELKVLRFPASLTTVPTSQFVSGCQDLEELDFSSTSVTDFPYSSAFTGLPRLQVFKFPSSGYTGTLFPSFSRCYDLTDSGIYNVPNSITTLSDYCFGSTQLYLLDRLPNVTSLSSGCFSYWEGETDDFIVPNNITTISDQVFYQSYEIKKISFLGDVSAASDSGVSNVFSYCRNLVTIDFSHNTTIFKLSNGASTEFSQCPRLTQIIVPHDLYDAWKADSNWSSISNKIVDASTL